MPLVGRSCSREERWVGGRTEGCAHLFNEELLACSSPHASTSSRHHCPLINASCSLYSPHPSSSASLPAASPLHYPTYLIPRAAH